MKFHISKVCRQEITPAMGELVTSAGMLRIPEDVLAPRQIKLGNTSPANIPIPVSLKWHRDAWVTTISRSAAVQEVLLRGAKWMKQSLLVYEMDTYLSDPDVKADASEFAKAKKASENGAKLVVVAVISDVGRSPLSVCRNVVSGCQNPDKLMEDAEKAIEAQSCILVED